VAEPNPAASGWLTCLRCGRGVESTWGYCPFCNAPLGFRQSGPPRETVDGEARRDQTLTGGGLIVLAVLAATGLMVFLCSGGLQWVGPVGILLAGVVLVAVVIAGIGLAARGRDGARSVGLGVGGAVAIAFISVGLTLAFVAAVIIGVFTACSNTCGGGAGRRSALPSAAPLARVATQEPIHEPS
jgi:hypothetical protein